MTSLSLANHKVRDELAPGEAFGSLSLGFVLTVLELLIFNLPMLNLATFDFADSDFVTLALETLPFMTRCRICRL